MSRLWKKVAECEYKEHKRLIIKQFINGLDDEGIISKILKGVSTLKNIENATRKRVLLWAQAWRHREHRR